MNPGGPTHRLILELCARLRLACEAVGPHGVDPADVSIDDLHPSEQDRLRHAAVQDLWALINQARPATKPVKTGRPKRRRGAA